MKFYTRVIMKIKEGATHFAQIVENDLETGRSRVVGFEHHIEADLLKVLQAEAEQMGYTLSPKAPAAPAPADPPAAT